MSKIGKKNIILPAGVEVQIEGPKVTVKGPKGTLSYTLVKGVHAELKDNEVVFTIDGLEYANLWGLSRTLVANMVEGVTHGYEKKLLLI
jgi:large subunit ribosomal protein L6